MGKIMVQGTASGVGKSIISSGICRILSQDGYRVIPFKSQNMSSNIYLDEDGKKMGVGQAVQAENCGITPKAYMNPILLKPVGNHNIEVFLNGDSIGVMSSDEFSKYKTRLVKMLEAGFKEIEQVCDVVVIEGAGSPVELNLDSVDLSNMKMAEIADSKVILVADIDKGGVFASVFGTLELLKPEERKRVGGIIVNKLRGQKEKFDSGVKIIEELTGIPVLGVLPFIDLQIDEEDSVGRCTENKEIKNLYIGEKSSADKNSEYDRLADHLRKNLDMDFLYKLIFEKGKSI